jgi:hypothetical protein
MIAPFRLLDLKAYNELVALAGRLYLYAYITVPKIGVPPWKKKQIDLDLWKHDGIRKVGNIMNYKARITPSGLELEGDLIPEDLQERATVSDRIALMNRSEEIVNETNIQNEKFRVDGEALYNSIRTDLRSPNAGSAVGMLGRLVEVESQFNEQFSRYNGILSDWISR